MNRDVPYDKEEVCEICGSKGAFDFMGDCICAKCLAKIRHEHRIKKHEQKKQKPENSKAKERA